MTIKELKALIEKAISEGVPLDTQIIAIKDMQLISFESVELADEVIVDAVNEELEQDETNYLAVFVE